MYKACGLLRQLRTHVFFVLLLLLPVTATATVGLSSFTLKPSTVVQGTPSVGTVTLNNPAPPGGATVTLTSLNPAVASVPGDVTIPQGATSAQVLVGTLAVTTPTVVTIQASYNGVFRSPQLTVTPRVAVRGVSGDLWADVIIGQPNFGDYTPHEVTNGRIFNPGGVEVDRSVQPNRVYAYDGANSRVLGLSHLGTCQGGSKGGQACTGNSDCPGSVCNVQEGIGADLVLGQPSFTTSGCNGDSNFQNFPTRAPASASTLCGMPEYQISIEEGFSWAHLAVDGAGNLYVPDFDNNRVVRYDSPFTTDTIADYVWGQPDFTGNGCNRGRGDSLPDAQSFCFRSIYNLGFTGGVEIDSAGNLWVSDNANHRVLRFSKDPNTRIPRTSADLVLGQSDFTSANPGAALNQMCAPASVRLDSAGNVYVADSQQFCNLGSTGRVLIFSPPLSNGMPATSALGEGLFRNPAGLELDPSAGFWVNDTGNNQFLFFPFGSTQPTKVLGKAEPDYSGACGSSGNNPVFTYADGGTADRTRVCGSAGGIGIDASGDIFVSAWAELQDMWRFPGPIPLISGTAYPADKRIFLPLQFNVANHVGLKAFNTPSGVAVAGSQLIVAESNRLMFWNDTSSLATGQPANGCLGDAVDSPPCAFEGTHWQLYGRMNADQASPRPHLWLIDNANNGQIEVYMLPLSSTSAPIASLTSPLPVLGGGSISWDDLLNIGGIASNGPGTRVWVADPYRNRVFRIRDPLTNPVVNIVLGQNDANGILCNQGHGDEGHLMPSQNSLCKPGNVTLDPRGNVYVSDDSLEVSGNQRLLEFDAGLFPDNPSTALFGIPATRVFGRDGSFTDPNCQLFLPSVAGAICGPLEPAFTSDGQMVIGMNGYIGSRFPMVYKTPLVSDQPDTFLNDFSSYGGYSAVFDSNNDLYITDLDRARVLVYRQPLPPLGPEVTLSPTNLNFGVQGVNLPNTPQTATLTNSGSAPLTITSIAITGGNSRDFDQWNNCPMSPSTLAPGDHCTITVMFAPTDPGALNADVTITDNASNSPQIVPLTGIGVGGKVRPR